MEISLAPESIFNLGEFSITNSFLMTLVISTIIILAALAIKRRIGIIPGGFQNAAEFVIEALLNLGDSVTQDRKQTKIFFPLVATIFIFVILSNWIEIIPGLGTVGVNRTHHGEEILVPFIRSNSADLNVALALALISVGAAQFMGVMALGVRKYSSKFLISPFKKPYFIGTFVGILEIISEFAKIVSFSFRLFGNIFAGEVLLTVILSLIPYIAPLPFLFLEIFVGFIQALVFSMLTLVFLKMAVTELEH